MYYRVPLVLLTLLLVPCLAPVAGGADSNTGGNGTSGAPNVIVTIERNRDKQQNADFVFRAVPSLSDEDAGQDASIEIIDGKPDWDQDVTRLNDGGGPRQPWDRSRTFSFDQGVGAAGRIRMDLGRVLPVDQVNTYSWHDGNHAPQVYALYGSDGLGDDFVPAPRRGVDPAAVGWVKIATIDTRPKGFPQSDNGAGQYGVGIAAASGGTIGRFRYLLWDVAPNIEQNPTACVFSEFDVVCGGPGRARVVNLRTTDGRTLSGQARLDGSEILIETADGPEVRVALKDVAELRCTPPAPQAVAARRRTSGLCGQYFTDVHLQTPRLVRYDPEVNFHWGGMPPDPAIPQNFSARWTGLLDVPFSDRFHFCIRANDGARLWVNGQQVINRWDNRQTFEAEGSAQLEGGKKAEFKLEFRNQQGEATVQLSWQSANGRLGRDLIRAARFQPPPDGSSAQVSLALPQEGAWLLTPGTLELAARIVPGASPITKVEFCSGTTVLGAATSPPYHFKWLDAPPGRHKLTVRATDSVGMISVSDPVTANVARKGNWPSQWGVARVGNLSDDNASYANGTFTIAARGGMLHGNMDSFQFVCQPLDGDGQVTARVVDLKADEPGALVGVTIRESLGPEARAVTLAVNRESAEFIPRREVSGWINVTNFDRGCPCYVRLVRQGNRLRGYLSDDGAHWQPAGSEEMALLSPRAFAGIVTASQTNDAECVAKFDHVEVSRGLPPGHSAARGVLMASGSLIAGVVQEVTATAVRLIRPRGQEMALPCSDVARILLQPLPGELLPNLPKGKSGVLLKSGDFFEGELREFKDNRVNIDSVLFGRRSFDANVDVMAIVMREPFPVTGARGTARIRDGSMLVLKSLRCDDNRVVLEDQTAGSFPISFRDLVELTLGGRNQ